MYLILRKMYANQNVTPLPVQLEVNYLKLLGITFFTLIYQAPQYQWLYLIHQALSLRCVRKLLKKLKRQIKCINSRALNKFFLSIMQYFIKSIFSTISHFSNCARISKWAKGWKQNKASHAHMCASICYAMRVHNGHFYIYIVMN